MTQDELKDIGFAMSDKFSWFDYKFDEQLKRFLDKMHLDGLERLSKFEFVKHAKFNLSDEWLEPIQKHIQSRAKLAMKFCDEKKDENVEQNFNKRIARYK